MSCNAVGKFPGERAGTVDLRFSSFSFSCVGSLVDRVGLRILLPCLCYDFFWRSICLAGFLSWIII